MAGTARTSSLGSFEWSAESSFAEDSSTVATRMIVRDEQIDVSGLQRPLVNRGGVFQRFNEGDNDVPGAFGVGTFTTTFDLYGHGSATDGALTQTNLCKLLAHVFGGVDVSQVGGQLTTGTNDENTITSTNTTLVTGGLLRVGALGDGRAEGQLTYALDDTSDYELGVDLPGSPTTDDDVYAMQLVYPISDVSNADIASSGAAFNNTLRVRLQTANLQFICHGVAPQSVSVSGLSPGEMPKLSITWQAAHWEPVNATFPDATGTTDYAPAPVANGSLFLNAKGTTTRATYTPRNFALNVGLDVTPIMGPGGVHDGQNVIGYQRVPAPTTLSFDVEAEASTATPTWWDYFRTDPNSITNKHIAYLLSPTDGRAVGFYFPNCKPIEMVPTQGSVDGLNYVSLQFEALTNTDTTSELTLSHWRMGLG